MIFDLTEPLMLKIDFEFDNNCRLWLVYCYTHVSAMKAAHTDDVVFIHPSHINDVVLY